MRFGPLLVDPRLALANAGVDTNVFNEAEDEGPRSDLTITVIPSADVWLRMGRTWVSGTVREDIVWYKDFTSERSINQSYRAAWVVPLTRVSFDVGAGWMHTRERPGFEIDARARRQEHDFTGGLEIRALSKTLFGVRGERRRVEFDETAVFLETNLNEELTRTSTSAAVTIRHELTPLTSLSLNLSRDQDRFDHSPLRDADSRRIDAGLDFDPFALISGTARFGYRDFDPADADLPGYSGATASVNLAYVALGSTRLAIQAMRDVQYSFDITAPYYLQSGISASLAQQIYGPVDVEGRIGGQRLAYRARGDGVAADQERVDRIRSYGAGAGYRVGPDLRIGVNVDKQRRRSEVDFRTYEGLRYGLAVTYGR